MTALFRFLPKSLLCFLGQNTRTLSLSFIALQTSIMQPSATPSVSSSLDIPLACMQVPQVHTVTPYLASSESFLPRFCPSNSSGGDYPFLAQNTASSNRTIFTAILTSNIPLASLKAFQECTLLGPLLIIMVTFFMSLPFTRHFILTHLLEYYLTLILSIAFQKKLSVVKAFWAYVLTFVNL